ncbi:MAG: response regulator [Clostridiales bacterium]|nr:response regulator [Clostridiales bacterium]
MLKVFLVEDEIVVREGIKNNINWIENGFIFCGEASDGELAYPMIQEMKPDIVITDIRMPFMDGLQLSRLIKKEMPWIKVIVLSGYEEFEYAQEAIDIGVTQYLLKPISGAELMTCIRNVRDRILKEQEEKLNSAKYKIEMKEYEESEKRRLFKDIVNNKDTLMNILDRGKALNLKLSSMAYNIILFKFYGSASAFHSVNQCAKVQKKLDELFDEKEDIIRFDCLLDGIALLLKGNSLEEISQIARSYIARIKEILKNYPELGYFGGIGRPVKRLGELSNSFREASRAFAYRYICDKSEIIDYCTIGNEEFYSVHTESLDMVNVTQLDRKKVITFLKSGNKEEVNYFVEEYLNCIGNKNRESLLFRQYIIMDMYQIVAGVTEEFGYEVDLIDKPFQDNEQSGFQIISFSHVKKYIEKIFCQVINIRDELATKHNNDVINRAKQYIKENYYKEDISLNSVASEVFLSPSHFSAVFSQKTGQTFIKYLTDLRMDKAKELLKCTDMRTSEIGYCVGYKDPHYFSYLFKKTQNCTPSQYRGGKRRNKDNGGV